MKCKTCINYSLYEMLTSGQPYGYGGDIPCESCSHYVIISDNYIPDDTQRHTITTEQWYNEEVSKIEGTPQYCAEANLLELEENICKIGGQPKGYCGLLFWLLEWIANKLIYRKTQSVEK